MTSEIFHLQRSHRLTQKASDDSFRRQRGRDHRSSFPFTGPMGSGKTEAVVAFIKRYGIGKRVLWLAPRITLSANTEQRLEEAGISFINYTKITVEQKRVGALDQRPYVICSIQSLHYLSKPFDIVIGDEIKTILNTFGGGANMHYNLNTNWVAFNSVIDNAAKVILMDALTKKATTNLVKGFIRKTSSNISDHLEVFKTARQPTSRTLRIVAPDDTPRAFDNWVAMMYQALEVGEKLYVFTPFKKGKQGINTITQVLLKAFDWTDKWEVLSYYAEEEQEKQDLCDANVIWGRNEMRCIVTNSAILVGVNFDRKDVSDQIFCLYALILPSRDFPQALYRA
ncbi:uncharacterized protein EV422DRAFT_507176 [Fimicolochytrium jonesii]|uniref:uncharacterized protein n=1 Tax=Fimicolochytrium jonesii TaxID=1396493 RepID=UPI0022FF38B4|nr:uncharacterized protein EV422DRAFT_507176 [Fimicolochytrium jonesii]KAI8820026.1 hypothetical protein EV422DRAFT_507176 [Fimicolochytrium jonesii]